MNQHTFNQITRFMGVLKNFDLTKDEIFMITSMMQTEDMMLEVVDGLEEKDFKATNQEVMNIVGKVVKAHLHEME